jgi:DNA-binding MarR family transcriptional regulator
MWVFVMSTSEEQLRFNGSLWCNLDIAARNMEKVYRRIARPLGLTVVELYILRSLYEQDGQYASHLASNVGRAATSFTPNLDKLEQKGYIERRADATDRRAVRIHLTDYGTRQKDTIIQSMIDLDEELAKHIGNDKLAFERALLFLQQSENQDS